MRELLFLLLLIFMQGNRVILRVYFDKTKLAVSKSNSFILLLLPLLFMQGNRVILRVYFNKTKLAVLKVTALFSKQKLTVHHLRKIESLHNHYHFYLHLLF